MIILTVTIPDAVPNIEYHILDCQLIPKNQDAMYLVMNIDTLSTTRNAVGTQLYFAVDSINNNDDEVVEAEFFDFEELVADTEHIALTVYNLDAITNTPLPDSVSNIIPIEATLSGIDITNMCSVTDYSNFLDYPEDDLVYPTDEMITSDYEDYYGGTSDIAEPYYYDDY